MKISYEWLQSYFDTPLPKPEVLSDKLTFHAFEVEGVTVVGDDTVFDIDVLPNRAHDCLSHRGIAKEVSALLSIPLNRDPLREKTKALPQSSLLNVSIEDPLLCRRYCGAVIRGVTVGPSPEWLKRRLEGIGQRSINNIVDATNYVMFSIGQPLHAFDMDKLGEKGGVREISVRNANDGESFTALDGTEYQLNTTMVVIGDGVSGGALGIAGIKGGVSAELSEATKDIIIESANFQPVSVRKTSQALRLRTDASTRFENEVAPDLAEYGLLEVVKLIVDIAGGEVEGIVDVYPKPACLPYKVGVSLDEIKQLLGITLSEKEVTSIFSRLGFEYEKVTPLEKVLALAPTFLGVPYTPIGAIRYDCGSKFSCSSFTNYLFVQAGVALPSISIDQYIYGEPISQEDIQPGDLVFSNTNEGKIRYETVGYRKGTAVSEGVDHCGLYIGNGRVIHATRSVGAVVEETLSDSKPFKNTVGFRRMTDNKERFVVTVPFERLDLRIKEDLIEEVGRIYGYEAIPERMPKTPNRGAEINKNHYAGEWVRSILSGLGFTDVYTYAFRGEGKVEVENPLARDKVFLRKNISDGLQEALVLNERNAPLLGLTEVKIFEIGKVFPSETEKDSVCIAIGTKGKGGAKPMLEAVVAELSDKLGVALKGAYTDTTFECDLAQVAEVVPEGTYLDLQLQKTIAYHPFSIYPFALRDIAVWVPEALTADSIIEIIKKSAGASLVHVDCFDEYKKEGRVSYAFHLVFQLQDKTLSEQEINSAMKGIENNLVKNNFEIR
jgi:phenylalanyl-tRNA synthetase beta subunit